MRPACPPFQLPPTILLYSPSDALGRSGMVARHRVSPNNPYPFSVKLLRQSTLKSTRLFFMMEMLGANTRFSVCFCNRLVFSDLRDGWLFWCFAFGYQRHKTCLIEVRYMVFRASKHARSKCETCPDATRNMPNGASDDFWWRSDLAKRAFPRSISRKIPTQLFNQKNRHAMPLLRP